MTERVVSFSPGPGVLPLPVLEQIQAEIVSLPGVGASPLEVSHRGAWFTGVLERAVDDLGALLDIPDTHRIVFCPGGASMQFSMVALNLPADERHPADVVVTGSWGAAAHRELTRLGPTRLAWSGSDAGYTRVPTPEELVGALSPGARLAHVTTNETIHGVRFASLPSTPSGVPLVADVSSDFLSGPLDIGRTGIVYAGAQKNAGPAGVAVVIVREDLIGRAPDGLPKLLDYRTYIEHGSLYNTPPVFAIYVIGLVARWLRDEIGGLESMRVRNEHKAALLYDEIDAAPGFYRGHAEPASRSLMNVTWRLPDDELERTFVEEAAAQGLTELRGHRSVGGIRTSIYNAMPLDGVEALAAFMRSFRDRHS